MTHRQHDDFAEIEPEVREWVEPWKITLATLAGDPWQRIWRAEEKP